MKKMTICKVCGKEIAKGSKVCPFCGAKKKGNKVAIGIAALLVVIGFASCGGSSETPAPVEDNEPKVVEEVKEEPKETEKEETKVPVEYKNALRAAKNYIDFAPFSKKGLYSQLTSDAERYSPEAAQYAIDNLKTDYKENALRSAKNYLDFTSFSKDGLYSQLTSDAEKYTPEEAQYAVDEVFK